ncbi:hypothetical protein IAE22_33890, partial [Bacillus sp. S34]|nr:hypothetical protein [Bacillus sp. S34]
MNEMTRLLHATMNNPQQNAADAPAFSVAKTESMTFTTAVDLTTAATYTVFVGDLPATIETCAPPAGDDDGDVKTNLVDRSHHDLRTYIGT